MQVINFGKYIRGLRDESGLTLRQVNVQSGVSDSYLSQVENGLRGIPSAEILKKLAPVYKKSYEEIFIAAGYLPPGSPGRSSEEESSAPKIANAIPLDETTIINLPIYGRISAGTPILAIEQADETISMDTRFFNMNGYSKDDFFFLRIIGHSMEPTIADNDLVLIRKQPTVENNEIAAVLCDSQDATVKRVVASGEKVILSSDNRDYPPMIYEASECYIIGKVLKKIGDVK